MERVKAIGPALLVAAGLACMQVVFMGCEKDRTRDGASTGSMSVNMTDAPGEYLEVNVDVREVRVHLGEYEDSSSTTMAGWVTLATRTGIYNLLDLQNDVTVALAAGQQLPAGKVTQIRLLLGKNNSVMLTDSTVFPLNVPSGMQSGIKINMKGIIAPGLNTAVVLDFDAGKSVLKTGIGSYLMTPVITVKAVAVQ